MPKPSARHVLADTTVASFWMGVRLVALAVWIVALAKALSPDGFGWLASLLGVCAVAALLVPAGIPYLFFAEAPRASLEEAPDSWAQCLGAVVCFGPLGAVLASALLVASIGAPVPFAFVMVFTVVDVVTGALMQSAALWLHSRGSLLGAAAVPATLSLGRMGAALGLMAAGRDGVGDYLVMHAACSVVVAASVLWHLSRKGRSLRLWRVPTLPTLASALPFALMGGGAVATGELDKPLIAKWIGLGPAGHYAAAYRVAAALATPATALAAAMLPRWSILVAAGNRRALRRSFLVAASVVFVFGAGVACMLAWLPGDAITLSLEDFSDSLIWLDALAWLAAGIGVHQVAGTAMIALGRPLARASIDAACVLLLAVLLARLGGQWSIDSVAVAIVAVEWVAACAMGAVVLLMTLESRLGSGVGREHDLN